MAIALELVEAGKRAGLGGYYLIPPFGKVALTVRIIAVLRQGSS
jgi:hypothetical protein